MALAPKLADFPRIRTALKLYRVGAYITGVMLLLLCAEMILKYGFGYSVYAFGNHGTLALVPWSANGSIGDTTGVDVSTGVLIAHGWLYVFYLFTDFWLWSLMRWNGLRFIAIALGGVVPFLSFFVEHNTSKKVNAYLAEREAAEAQKSDSTGGIQLAQTS
jgi:integral membrane protein